MRNESTQKKDLFFPARDLGARRPLTLPKLQAPWRLIALIAGLGLTIYFTPTIWMALIGAHLGVYIGVSILQFFGLRSAPHNRKRFYSEPNQWPFVSIHVPTHNEPPEVLKSTLQALRQIDYPNYEVIVLDNNTPDPRTWKPIEKYCQEELGKPFRFYHFDSVKGYKAGALNISRTLTHPQAEYIAVVDADYIVEPHFIQRGLAYFDDAKVSHVQFPQAYYNTNTRNDGLRNEYAHYFELILPAADRWQSPLLTGTMCFVRINALNAVGGWGTSSITEDAELGLKFILKGYAGRYVPEIIGRGLMPEDLKSLRKQRQRWVFGNAQSLFQFIRQPWRHLEKSQVIGVLLQLTAWFNFLFLPFWTLLISAHLMTESPSSAVQWVFWLSLTHFALYLILSPLKFLLIRRKLDPRQKRCSLRACLVHVGLSFEGACAWFECLLGQKLGFWRTNKFRSKNEWKELWPHIFLGILIIECAAWLGLHGLLWPAASLMMILLIISAVFHVRSETA